MLRSSNLVHSTEAPLDQNFPVWHFLQKPPPCCIVSSWTSSTLTPNVGSQRPSLFIATWHKNLCKHMLPNFFWSTTKTQRHTSARPNDKNKRTKHSTTVAHSRDLWYSTQVLTVQLHVLVTCSLKSSPTRSHTQENKNHGGIAGHSTVRTVPVASPSIVQLS